MCAYLWLIYRSFTVLYAFQIFPCVARSDELLLTICSEVDINATPISAYLADSMDKLTDSTTINQADDNKPFNDTMVMTKIRLIIPLLLFVIGFENSWLSHTQQKGTLFTITQQLYTLTNHSDRYWYWFCCGLLLRLVRCP